MTIRIQIKTQNLTEIKENSIIIISIKQVIKILYDRRFSLAVIYRKLFLEFENLNLIIFSDLY